MTEGYPSNWERLRKEVYERDNFTCQNCGSLGGQKGNTELHAHHVVPKAKGGGHHLSNLKTLCKSCHNAVHGGESVQGHVQNQSSGLEGILHFPDLAETMEYYTGATPSQEIGICLSEQSPGFLDSLSDMFGEDKSQADLPAFIRSTLSSNSISWETQKDDHEYTWISLQSEGYIELLLATHDLVREITESARNYHLLAVLFPFDLFESESSVLYWVYSHERNSFYPFAPISMADNERNNDQEFKARKLGEETIRVEQDLDYWYPMWSEVDGLHPWESTE